MESKYIVFKREDFTKDLGNALGHSLVRLDGAFKEVDDVIALRLQDKFTAPTMQAYFDAVCNVIEVLDEFGMPDEMNQVEDLHHLRDWAFDMVSRARHYRDTKIPDA